MLIVKFRGLIDKIIQVLSTIIMGVMVIAVCWQVITRYILNNPSTVTEEALRYLLIWVTMVGGAYAYGRRKHLAITALSKRLSFKGQKILDIFVQAMVILFCVVVMIGGGTRLVNTAADQLSAALQLPMPLIYASVPVGAILFIFYALIFIGEDLRDMKQGDVYKRQHHSSVLLDLDLVLVCSHANQCRQVGGDKTARPSAAAKKKKAVIL